MVVPLVQTQQIHFPPHQCKTMVSALQLTSPPVGRPIRNFDLYRLNHVLLSMWCGPQENITFLAIAKTGTRTLRRIMSCTEHCHDPSMCRNHGHQCREVHIRPSFLGTIDIHKPLSSYVMPPLCLFGQTTILVTILRDPVARLFSEYTHVMNNNTTKICVTSEAVKWAIDSYRHNWQTAFLTGKRWFPGTPSINLRTHLQKATVDDADRLMAHMRDDKLITGVFEYYERSVRHILRHVRLPMISTDDLRHKSFHHPHNTHRCLGGPLQQEDITRIANVNKIDAALHAFALKQLPP